MARLLTSTQGDTKTLNRPHISAIFSDTSISVSGRSHDLQELKSKLGAHVAQCRWAQVHALYHGGPKMEELVLLTMRDLELRNIEFATWETLCCPVRSVAHGDHLNNNSGTHKQSLLQTVLKSIFVDKVDWRVSKTRLRELQLQVLRHDEATKLRTIGLGPGSRNLIYLFHDDPSHDMIEDIENWAEYVARPAADDVAIVGLSVNYPGAQSYDELWDLLEKCQSTVSEVSSSIR